MKRNLARLKNGEYPKNIKACEEIRDMFTRSDIREKFGLTYDNDAKFYIETVVNDDYAFTVFASEFVINTVNEHIHGERKYLMDATFDCIPEAFYQLLIISIEYKNDVSTTQREIIH